MSFLQGKVRWRGIYARRFKKKPIMDGLTRHRSQATAQASVGMTCLLRPAFTSMDASLPCHSSRGMCERGNLWEAVQEAKAFKAGLNKYRSHATAQASVGKTYLLRPAPSVGMTCFQRSARQILSFYDNHFMTKCVYLQRKNRKQI